MVTPLPALTVGATFARDHGGVIGESPVLSAIRARMVRVAGPSARNAPGTMAEDEGLFTTRRHRRC